MSLADGALDLLAVLGADRLADAIRRTAGPPRAARRGSVRPRCRRRGRGRRPSLRAGSRSRRARANASSASQSLQSPSRPSRADRVRGRRAPSPRATGRSCCAAGRRRRGCRPRSPGRRDARAAAVLDDVASWKQAAQSGCSRSRLHLQRELVLVGPVVVAVEPGDVAPPSSATPRRKSSLGPRLRSGSRQPDPVGVADAALDAGPPACRRSSSRRRSRSRRRSGFAGRGRPRPLRGCSRRAGRSG